MSHHHWEGILEDLGERAWDDATSLVSTIHDEHFPTLINRDDALEICARIVRDLFLDGDYREMVEELLAATADLHGRPTTEPPSGRPS